VLARTLLVRLLVSGTLVVSLLVVGFLVSGTLVVLLVVTSSSYDSSCCISYSFMG
jgi:hypothetical protein